jgi:hypothetical protein
MEFTKWQLEVLSELVSEKSKEAYKPGNTTGNVTINGRSYQAFPESAGDENNLKALDDKLEAALQSK